MDQPALYRKVNKLQRHDGKMLLQEYSSVIHLRTDGKDSLIDIGCGTGDVLMDFIQPILPETFTKVIGTDISTKMVEYCRDIYGKCDKVNFKVLDIETVNMPNDYHEQFDHVTSFFCLHWIQNQRQALRNIYNMLTPDGDCLLVFLSTCFHFDAYKILAKDPKWSEYMKDVEKFIPPLQNNLHPEKTYTNLFNELGFIDLKVELRPQAYIFEGYDGFRDHLTAVDPFVGRMSLSEREEYMQDMCDVWKQRGAFEKMEDKEDYRCTLPYTLLVACARK